MFCIHLLHGQPKGWTDGCRDIRARGNFSLNLKGEWTSFALREITMRTLSHHVSWIAPAENTIYTTLLRSTIKGRSRNVYSSTIDSSDDRRLLLIKMNFTDPKHCSKS